MTAPPKPVARILELSRWRQLRSAHEARVDAELADVIQRRESGVPHPGDDFLFTYYRYKPSQLRQWHPGAGVGLRNADGLAASRFYRRTPDGVTVVDVDGFGRSRRPTVDFVLALLDRTAAAAPLFSCFGLHEWAMVHGATGEQVRHPRPLRLGARGTDDVVRQGALRCTHFDAFRFFTAAARPLNATAPTVDDRLAMEQPGCLHTNMDLYKWAYKLTPVVSSELVLDCFRLARRIRSMDMRASPYDLRDLGMEPVAVETAAGRADYVAAQRQFSAEAAVLRERLRAAVRPLAGDSAG